MTIIPAIDIIDGKCVRLTQGDYNSVTTYDANPVDIAKQFEDHGLTRLHLVDLDGARLGRVRNWKVLENIAAKTNLKIDFSGGICSQKHINIALSSGAWYINIGTMAIRHPEIVKGWIIAYGAGRFIISADSKNGLVQSNGWTNSTDVEVNELIGEYKACNVLQYVCTDIASDGMLSGPAFDLYDQILTRHPDIELVASGGISSMHHVNLLRNAGCKGAIIGKAIYENKIKLRELNHIGT